MGGGGIATIAVFDPGLTLTLTSCKVHHNTASGHSGGGGLRLRSTLTKLIGCEVYSNTANTEYAGCMTARDCGMGGGISVGPDSTPSIALDISGTEIYSNNGLLVRARHVNRSPIAPSPKRD